MKAHSLLFVPGKPKMMSKIETSHADAYIIDLEDSITEKDRQQALEDVCAFLDSRHEKKIYIRVSEGHFDEQFSKLKNYNIAGYMIPKFECYEQYNKYTSYFQGKEVIALIETPLGIINLKEIASCPFVTTLAFGAEDYSAAIGMKNSTESIYFARSVIVLYGRAFKKAVFDTPSFIIDDFNALDAEIQTAMEMGFDGKMAIHPKQIERINTIFHCADPEALKEIIDQYEKSGEAVLRIGNNVYEKMHISHYKKILEEYKQ